MQSKVAVTLILFLFPALVAPLILLAFLTRVPGGIGAFFTDYAFAFVWGLYALLIAGGGFLFYRLKRQAGRQAKAESAAPGAAVDEARTFIAKSQQE
jgi:uncharacterized membrane-anchored protein